MIDPSFWRGRKVLVTGHTGFKGGWMSLWLHRLGAETVGYALPPPTRPSLYDVADVESVCASVIGDVRDSARLAIVVREQRPEVIFHMAAQPLVRRSYVDPVETYATNVMGTVHLLEAARTCDSVRSIVVVTSDKCYENKEWPWGYRESDPMGGHDPYSNSKGCAELVTSAYRKSFFSVNGRPVGLASARAGNVIGGGDWAEDRLVPDIIRALTSGDAIYLRSPDAVRPWQHVLEPISGYLLLAQSLYTNHEAYSEGWNFGPNPDAAVPVSNVAEQLVSLWDAPGRIEYAEGPHPHEASYLSLDISKARHELGWVPQINLSTALEWTADWFANYERGSAMQAVTMDQIGRYQHLISRAGVREAVTE